MTLLISCFVLKVCCCVFTSLHILPLPFSLVLIPWPIQTRCPINFSLLVYFTPCAPLSVCQIVTCHCRRCWHSPMFLFYLWCLMDFWYWTLEQLRVTDYCLHFFNLNWTNLLLSTPVCHCVFVFDKLFVLTRLTTVCRSWQDDKSTDDMNATKDGSVSKTASDSQRTLIYNYLIASLWS